MSNASIVIILNTPLEFYKDQAPHFSLYVCLCVCVFLEKNFVLDRIKKFLVSLKGKIMQIALEVVKMI